MFDFFKDKEKKDKQKRVAEYQSQLLKDIPRPMKQKNVSDKLKKIIGQSPISKPVDPAFRQRLISKGIIQPEKALSSKSRPDLVGKKIVGAKPQVNLGAEPQVNQSTPAMQDIELTKKLPEIPKLTANKTKDINKQVSPQKERPIVIKERNGEVIDVNNPNDLIEMYKVRPHRIKEFGGTNPTIGNIDLTTKPYATSLNHVKEISNIYNTTKGYTIEDMRKDFARLGSPLQYIVDEIGLALNRYGITPGEFTAVVRQDSGAGTRGKGSKTKNPGNVGNDDTGRLQPFDTWLEGSVAAIRNLAERSVDNYTREISNLGGGAGGNSDNKKNNIDKYQNTVNTIREQKINNLLKKFNN